MKRFGLADALGIVGALAAIASMPGLKDTLTPVKLLALAAGGVCLAPAVAARWRAMGRPSWSIAVPCVGVVLIVVWGLISIAGARAPLWDALFGWWGRGDGWLAWLGAAVLLLGAVTLSSREIVRTISWLLVGATIAAVIGLAQVAGLEPVPSVGGPVVGLMGNTNFAAGYFAILALLALGRALSPAIAWQRIWAGLLFLTLTLLAWQTGAKQGPAAMGAGVVAFIVVWAVLRRGRHRTAGLIVVAAILVFGAGLLVLSAFATGPLALLWSEPSFAVRQQYWQTALNMMAGQPVFGSGPSGFARYVSEYRTEEYVAAVGPTIRVSAAHNIALQFGATLGFPGLILWLIAFLGSALALGIRVFRGPVTSIALTASVAGAFTAYLVQGMVSIDMLPLLATGWLVAGLALACAREPAGAARMPGASTVQPRARSTASPASEAEESSSTPLWVPITGAVLGVAVALLVGTQITLNQRLSSGITPQEGLGLVTDRMVPCAIRSDYAASLPAVFPPQIVATAIVQATELDRHCPPMVQMAAEVAVRQQILALAESYTADAVRLDPLLANAWVLRGRYFLGAGDLASAEAAAAEARRVHDLYPREPVDARSEAAVTGLEQMILRARVQLGVQGP